MRIDRPPPGEELNPGDATVPRGSASLIVLRDTAEGPEVLLVQRNPEQRFMGGAWVFPGGATGPGVAWPLLALVAGLGAWLATLSARRLNAREAGVGFYLASGGAILAAAASVAALLLGPSLTGLEPSTHAYAAIVWLLSAWTALHVALGILMLLYCVARRWAKKMSGTHDIDIRNVALYWHFVAIKLLVTVAVIAGFPLLA